MYTGSCLCGLVKFEITGKISNIVYCHCSQCRKVQGSAFATNGIVNVDEFHFVSGDKNLTAYESSPGKIKYFCRTCGSPVMSKIKNEPNFVRVRLGTIDGDVSERPGSHIFAGSKANWYEILDRLPQYEEFPEK